jgi:hypothetical protein
LEGGHDQGAGSARFSKEKLNLPFHNKETGRRVDREDKNFKVRLSIHYEMHRVLVFGL